MRWRCLHLKIKMIITEIHHHKSFGVFCCWICSHVSFSLFRFFAVAVVLFYFMLFVCLLLLLCFVLFNLLFYLVLCLFAHGFFFFSFFFACFDLFSKEASTWMILIASFFFVIFLSTLACKIFHTCNYIMFLSQYVIHNLKR